MTEEEELTPLREWLATARPIPQRVLGTGSRTWTRGRLIRLVCHLPWPPGCTLIEGDAQGADRMLGQLWAALGRPVESHPLPERWWLHGGRAVPLARDQRMVDSGADVCVALIRAYSNGATATATMAEQAGMPVFRFRQEA